MNITFDKLIIEIDRNEAFLLYGTIKRFIEDRIKDHWKFHPGSYEQLEQRLPMLRELSRYTNNCFEYDAAELRELLQKESKQVKVAQ